MDKYLTSVKDLVIEVLSNFSIIKTSADKGDASSCFKMGMIHLLGIDTAVDFKKAVKYFENQSLVDNQVANRLLAFIAELEGNFSQAFHYYESTESTEKDSYLDKVIKGRNKLQDYLKKLNLPITVNKDISTILGDYSKGKASKVGACIKIATICNDEISCLEAAKALYDSNDLISAVQWLQKGCIGPENTLYAAINEKFKKSKENLLHSKEIEVIELDGNSLVSIGDPTPFLNKVKESCKRLSAQNSLEWKKESKKIVDTLKKEQKDKEWQEMLEAIEEEKARKKRHNKIVMYCAIAASILLFYIIGSINSANDSDSLKDNSDVDTMSVSFAVKNAIQKSGYDLVLSQKKLSDSDLEGKSKKELEIMRNSIYARYGYKFKREDLQKYFSQYSWYNPTTSDMSSVYEKMNDFEKYNVDLIKKHE